MTTITNTAPGLRGVHLSDGTTLYIEPGQTVEDVDVAKGHKLYEGLVEGSAPKLSAMKRDDLVAIADAEGVAYETDDNRADLIAKIEAHRGAAA